MHLTVTVTHYYFSHFRPDFNFLINVGVFLTHAHMECNLGEGNRGKSVCNMLIDSANAFRWVIFHNTAFHRVLVGTQHIHKQTHKHTRSHPSTKLGEIRPKTSAAAARLLKYEWF